MLLEDCSSKVVKLDELCNIRANISAVLEDVEKLALVIDMWSAT